MAATIRSSTTSFCVGSKIEGSMSSIFRSPLTEHVAVTSPAPLSPTTFIRAKLSCNSAILACISCAAFIIFDMSPRPASPPNPFSIVLSPLFLKWVPVVVGLGQGRCLRHGCGSLGRSDLDDLCLRECREHRLNQGQGHRAVACSRALL